MKYRLLSQDELQALEQDLKAFLIVNGVDGDTWLKINQTEPDKALALVELFSDTVLQTVYEKIHYLEFRSQKNCITFHIKEDSMDLISLQLKEGVQANLATAESIHDALLHNAKDITWSKSTRKHSKLREQEIHQLLEQGCVPSVEEFWVSLNKLIENE